MSLSIQQAQAGQAAEARAAEAAARAEEIAARVQERLAAAQERLNAPDVRVIQPGQIQVIRPGSSSPTAVYEALRQQREELRSQLRRLEEQREELTVEMAGEQAQQLPVAAQKGAEARLAGVDARIAQVEGALAEADAAVARAAAVPGAVQPPPPPRRDPGPPEEFWVLSGMFIFFVLMPIAVAYARRLWKRGSAAVAAIPQEIYDRFNRLDQAIDSVAIEVERVGEGQRFLTRVYAEQRGLGAGQAERIETPERVAQRQNIK